MTSGGGGSRAIGTVPQQLSTWLVCETRSLISLELTVYARLAGQLAPGTHMTPPPQSWSYKFRPPCPFYFMVSGKRTQSQDRVQARHRANHLPPTYLPASFLLWFLFLFFFSFAFSFNFSIPASLFPLCLSLLLLSVFCFPSKALWEPKRHG